MIRNFNKVLFVAVLGASTLLSSCKKYLDVNQNLNDPTNVPLSTLLTGAERSIGGALSLGTALGNGLAVYTHQMTGRTNADRYSMNAPTMDGAWGGMYGAITNLNVIIEQGTAGNNLQYVGIAKILKAYAFSMMVDIWGDIPFSEYDKFKQGIRQPKFDDDAAIYPQLITLLDQGIADLLNPVINSVRPGADDVIYGGFNATSNRRWIKAANTIKLKLYTQMRLVSGTVPNYSTIVNNLLANPAELINANNESFIMPFGPSGATDDRSPAYADYIATQRGGMLISPWLYTIMKGINPVYYNGIVDPRIPYYIYNQKTGTGTPENCTEYRDGGFISILFGSNGPCRDGANSNTYSMLGIYPAGGRYDDGAGLSVTGTGPTSTANAGTGATPMRFITYADRLYLQAELMNAGIVAGDPRPVFSAALDASFTQMDFFITTYIKSINQTIPAIATQAATTTYKNSILAIYDAASTSGKLEQIMTQKWLSRFGNSVDQYTDFRRTGFPVMFDPNNPVHAPGGRVQPPLTGNPLVNPQNSVPVANNVPFPQSLPWSQNELDLNGNAPKQKAPDAYKIFWRP